MAAHSQTPRTSWHEPLGSGDNLQLYRHWRWLGLNSLPIDMDNLDNLSDSVTVPDWTVSTSWLNLHDKNANLTDIVDDNSTSVKFVLKLPSPSTKQLTVAIIQIFLCPLVFLGNLLILIAIRKSRSMKQVTFLFLGHLAVSDLLLGFSIFMRVFFLLQNNLIKLPCLIVHLFTVLASGCSMTGILFLSLDCYLSVKFSMQLRPIITPKIAWVMIFMCWLLWGAYNIYLAVQAMLNPLHLAPCFLGGGYYSKITLAPFPSTYLLHLLIVIYLQITTLLAVKKHFKQLRNGPSGQQTSSTTDQNKPGDQTKSVNRASGHKTLTVKPVRESSTETEVTTISQSIDTNRPQGNTSTQMSVSKDNQREKRLKKLTSMNRIVGLVLLSYFICWFPSMTLLLLFAVCDGGCGVPPDVMLVTACLIVVSSMANVCVYAAKSPEFRVMFRRLLCCTKCKNEVNPQELSQTVTPNSHSTNPTHMQT